MTIGSMGSEKKTVITLEEEEKCRKDVASIDEGLTTIEEYLTQRSGTYAPTQSLPAENSSRRNFAHELDLPTTLAQLSTRVRSIASQLPPKITKREVKEMSEEERTRTIVHLKCEEQILLMQQEVLKIIMPTQDMDACDHETEVTEPTNNTRPYPRYPQHNEDTPRELWAPRGVNAEVFIGRLEDYRVGPKLGEEPLERSSEAPPWCIEPEEKSEDYLQNNGPLGCQDEATSPASTPGGRAEKQQMDPPVSINHTVPNLPPTSQYGPTSCDNTNLKADEEMRRRRPSMLQNLSIVGPPNGQYPFSAITPSESALHRTQVSPMFQSPMSQFSPPIPNIISSSSSTSSKKHIRRNMICTMTPPLAPHAGSTGTSPAGGLHPPQGVSKVALRSVFADPSASMNTGRALRSRVRTNSSTSMGSRCEPIHETRGTSQYPNLVPGMSQSWDSSLPGAALPSQWAKPCSGFSSSSGSQSQFQQLSKTNTTFQSHTYYPDYNNMNNMNQSPPNNGNPNFGDTWPGSGAYAPTIFDSGNKWVSGVGKKSTQSNSAAAVAAGTNIDTAPAVGPAAGTNTDTEAAAVATAHTVDTEAATAVAAGTNTKAAGVCAADHTDARECHFGGKPSRTSVVSSSSLASSISTNGIMHGKGESASVSTHSTSHERPEQTGLEQATEPAEMDQQQNPIHESGLQGQCKDKGLTDDRSFSKRARDKPSVKGEGTNHPSHVWEQTPQPIYCDPPDQMSPHSSQSGEEQERTHREKSLSPALSPIRPSPEARRGPARMMGSARILLRASTEELAKGGEERSNPTKTNHAAIAGHSSPQSSDLTTPREERGEERTKAENPLRPNSPNSPSPEREARSGRSTVKDMKNGKRTNSSITANPTTNRPRPLSVKELSASPKWPPTVGTQRPRTSRRDNNNGASHNYWKNYSSTARRTISSDAIPKERASKPDGDDASKRNLDLLLAGRIPTNGHGFSQTLPNFGKFNCPPNNMKKQTQQSYFLRPGVTKGDSKFNPQMRRGSHDDSIKEDKYDGGHCNSNSNSSAGKGGACYSKQRGNNQRNTSSKAANAERRRNGWDNNVSNQRNGGVAPVSGKITDKSSCDKNSRCSPSNANMPARMRSNSTFGHTLRGPARSARGFGRAQSAHSTNERAAAGGLHDQNVNPNVNTTNTWATSTKTATTNTLKTATAGTSLGDTILVPTTTSNLMRNGATVNKMGTI